MPDRLHYHINMQREKERHKKHDNKNMLYKSKFVCYCFKLVFITKPLYVICHMCWDAKLGHGPPRAQETDLASSRTLLETLGPSADHDLINVLMKSL